MNPIQILEQSLEYCDVDTLLKLLFLSKNIHAKIMNLLKKEFELLNRFNHLFSSDIYAGIWFFRHGYYQNFEYYEDIGYCYRHMNEITKFFKAEVLSYSNCKPIDLLKIYAKLYPFNVNTKANYIADPYLEDLTIFVNDFKEFLPKYHYKISLKVLEILIGYMLEVSHDNDSLKLILDKNFNVNKILKIGNYKATILHHVIRADNWHIINLILDKNPNVYIRDSNDKKPFELYKNHCRRYVKNFVFEQMEEKFKKLEAGQKKSDELIWL